MSTFMHAESRRLYSWWWDSHISPKNSKWLQENLADMDTKVKDMIRLIEEDADSFARRAEMYYKKRPELMKLVEDFYRAYRALAERYDQATGALRHAHRTMTEAFPNHIPLALPDESPSISSGTEVGPYTPEMPPSMRALFGLHDLQKDALSGPTYFHTVDRSGAYAEENESIEAKKGLKQLNQMFAPREGALRVKLHEGKVRKILHFQEEEENVSHSKIQVGHKTVLEQEVKEKENAKNEIKRLQEEVSQLLIENQNLKRQIVSESNNLNFSRTEVQNLRDAMSAVQSEKEVIFFQNLLSQERIYSLETEISRAKDDLVKLHEEVIMGIVKLCSSEEQCLALEMVNQNIKAELEERIKKSKEIQAQSVESKNLLEQEVKEKESAQNVIKCFQEELSKVSIENHNLMGQILSDSKHLQLSRAEAQNMRDEMSKLKSEKDAALLQNLLKWKIISDLETEIFQAKDEIGKLHEEIVTGIFKLGNAEERCLALEEANQCQNLELEEMKRVLEVIQMLCVENQNLLEQQIKEKQEAQHEIKYLQGVSQLSIKNQNLKSQIVSISKHLDASRAEIQNLRDATSKLECEKEAALFQNRLSRETKSSLETEILRAKDEIRKLHEEIFIGIVKLCSTEEKSLALEKENQFLNFEFEERKNCLKEIQAQSIECKYLLELEVKEKENAINEIKYFQEVLSKVSIENQNLKSLISSESKCLHVSRAEIQNMRNAVSNLESEKEAALLQNLLSRDRISDLETIIFQAKDEIRKLHEEIVMGIFKLRNTEERCLALEKENECQKLELEERKRVLEEIQMLSAENQNLLEQEVKEKENALNEIKYLQEGVSHLSIGEKNLKSLIVSESKHLDTSRIKLHNLRDAMSKLQCEKEDALFENRLSRERISSLETEIFRAKDEVRKLYEEILMGIVKLRRAEEQQLSLNNANQSLKIGLEEREKRLKEFRIYLQESDKKHTEAEISLQSMKQLYNLSQEKVEHMTLEFKTHFEKLKDIAHRKVCLEEEVLQLKDIHFNLNEQSLAYESEIKKLQGDIIWLNDVNSELDKVKIHSEDRKVLQQELDFIKVNRNELGLKNKSLIEQMVVTTLKIDSLDILVRELQSGNTELTQGCKKLEDENQQLFNKLEDMEAISDRNAVLESSLFSATMELEELRGKIRVLEDSYEFLNTKFSTHDVEKTALASQIEVLAENLEKLLVRNTLFENSLVDASFDREVLRSKVNELEESNQFLYNENTNLLVQKNVLISQVDSIQQSLKNSETRHTMLADKHINLEKEKDVSVAQVMELKDALEIKKKEHRYFVESSKIYLVTLENQIHLLQEDRKFREDELEVVQQKCTSYMIENFVLQRSLRDMQDSLKTEKLKHEFLIQSSEIQLATLQSQIHLLQEHSHIRDEKFEEEQLKFMNSMLENFILQAFLSEVREKSLILWQECQKHLEACRCACEVISQLESSKFLHEGKIARLVKHNTKLRDGIQYLLESLNINKQLMNMDGSEDVLQTILAKVNDLLAMISDTHDQNQLPLMELSVYQTLLKQTGLEKNFLGQELGRMDCQLDVLWRDQHQLFEKCEKLGQDVNDRDGTIEALKADLESLSKQLSNLSKEFYNLREEKSALEEENNVMLGEAMTLEHLYLFFRSSNTENMQSLKVFGDEICSLTAVNNDQEQDIKESKERLKVAENENKRLDDFFALLEELISRMTVLEFDLFTSRNFCEELILHVEIGENMLKMKSMELLKAYHKLQRTQEEVNELCSKLDATNTEMDESKRTRLQSKEKVTGLLEGHSCKDVEIDNNYNKNRMLTEEFGRLNVEVEVLRKREHHLSSELQKRTAEVDRSEGEISKLMREVQICVVNRAVLEEKMFELTFASEGLEICAFVQRKILIEGIALRNVHAFELKKKINDLESENRELKSILKEYFQLFISLGNGISNVENQAHQLVKNYANQDNPLNYYQEKSNETSTCDNAITAGALELQNLILKVEALQKLMIDTNSHLEQERLQYAVNLEAARIEIERLKLESSDRKAKQDKETSSAKHGQLVKDIELDQVSNSNVLSRIQSSESDQMLKLWETDERDIRNSVSNVHGIEAVNEVKSEHSTSELIDEKELAVDKLEISKELKKSQEDWKRTVIERLSSYAEKLSALQTTAEELKAKMERSGKNKRQRSSEHNSIGTKLKEAEEGIAGLLDVDSKLRKKVEECSKSCNGEEMGRLERWQVLEQVQSVSEQIEKLALELQKIHYIFLKLEEDECETNKTQSDYRTPRVPRVPRVLLGDYIYGRVGQGRKRGHFCGCIRPKIKD